MFKRSKSLKSAHSLKHGVESVKIIKMSEFFWSIFFQIPTECGKIRTKKRLRLHALKNVESIKFCNKIYSSECIFKNEICFQHCMKSVQIRSFSGPYFPVFSPDTGKYGLEKTPYLDTFHTVQVSKK